MTSPLRRKRPITVRVRSTAIPTACSLLLLLAGAAGAQPPPSPSPAKSAYAPWPVSAAPPHAAATPQQTRAFPTARQRQQPLPPGRNPPPEEWEQPAYTIQLEVPPIDRVAISVESDAQLKERIRQENRGHKNLERVIFPADPVISTETYQGRKWYPMRLEVAPYYVCHGRLRFHQINFERYGWDLGVLAPIVSAGTFLFDFVTLPYHLAMEPCRCFEYNTGWCLPGDPAPLLLYPLHISPTGFVAEVGTILTLVAVFP